MSDQTVSKRVRELVEAPLAAAGFELVEIEHRQGLLRVTVDRSGGIDLDAVDTASRLVSGLLDEADPVPSGYTLEVSSPGIERPLRTPEHFRHFVGESVAVKTTGGPLPARLSGVLEAADAEGVMVGGQRVAYGQIRSARTVFVWPVKTGAGR